MNKKSFIRIFLLTTFILLMSLSLVSANDSLSDTTSGVEVVSAEQDNSNIDYSSVDKKINNEEVSTDDINVKNNNKTNTNDKLSENSVTVNSYAELVNAVNTALSSNESNYTISLSSGDYNATANMIWGDGSGSTRTLIIEGNNNTLNGTNLYQFMVVNKGYTLILNNITLTNYNGRFGGTILVNNDGFLMVTNSTFKYNNVSNCHYGGVLYYNTSVTNISIYGNTFLNNSVRYEGGAIVFNGSVINGNISENNFTNNEARFGHGGAIVFSNVTNLSMSNNIFRNNTAAYDTSAIGGGGAIFFNDTLINADISNNGFINNYGNQTSGGGAIRFNCPMINVNLSENNFTDNHVDGLSSPYYSNGGAILFSSSNMTNVSLSNNILTNNTALYGGAIHFGFAGGTSIFDFRNKISNLISLSMSNNVFINNKANDTQGYGGAIYFITDGTNYSIINNSFSNNSASWGGSALFLNNFYNSSISNNIFLGNNGSCVYFNGSVDNSSISDNIFNDNTGAGAAIYYRGFKNGNISNNNFTNNSAGNGGVIVGSNTENVQISENNFISNKAEYSGGALYLSVIYNSTILNNNFTNNEVTDSTGVGGAIFIMSTADNLIIMNNNFVNNSAYLAGGAIGEFGGMPEYGFDEGSILNSKIFDNVFINNTSYGSGGAILFNSVTKTNISNNNFTNNKASTIGGAVYFNSTKGDIYASNNIFTTNRPVNFDIESNKVVLENTDNYIDISAFSIYLDGTLLGSGTSQSALDRYTLSEYDNAWIVVNDTKSSSIETNNNIYVLSGSIEPETDKINTTINVTVNNVTVGLDTLITGTLITENGTVLSDKEVVLYVNGVRVGSNSTDSSGKYVYNYTTGLVGINTVNVTFAGDNTYATSSAVSNFIVSEVKMIISVSADNITLGSTNRVNGTVLNTKGTTMADKSVEIYLNGELLTTVVSGASGNYEYNFTTIQAGANLIMVKVLEDSSYSAVNATIFTANRINNTLTLSAKNVTMGSLTTINGTVLFSNSSGVSGRNVSILVNGILIANLTTDNNGVFTTTYNTSSTGTFIVQAIIDETTNYTSADKNILFTVSPTTSKITITVRNVHIGNNTLNGTLVDANGKAIAKAVVYMGIGNNATSPVVTNSTGGFTWNYTINSSGSKTFKAVYEGNGTYNASNTTVTSTATKLNATITVDKINAWINDTIELKAYVVDQYGNNATSGSVTFRLNGTTITVGGKSAISNVINGVATYTLQVPTSWYTNSYVLTAYYNGSSQLNSATSTSSKVNVSLRNATIQLLAEAGPFKAGETVKLRVIVQEGDKLVSNGQVLFKLNGITLKYSNGSAIYANVKNGVGEVTWTIPTGYTASTYNLTGVFGGGIYERHEQSTRLVVAKVATHLNVSVYTTNNSNIRITADIFDGNNVRETGSSRVSVKIAGSTIFNSVTVNNGKIDLNTTLNIKAGLYSVVIIAGENSAYQGTRTTTYLIRT